MSISKCIVRLKDCHNTEHSVEVYAESLYEAVLRGLSRLQDVGWESVQALGWGVRRPKITGLDELWASRWSGQSSAH
jgi:hypothetical protein